MIASRNSNAEQKIFRDQMTNQQKQQQPQKQKETEKRVYYLFVLCYHFSNKMGARL